ncbi:MAG: 50S ribosomal protein L31 [Candidatus Peregrinibacteria bacterium]
MPKAGIHPQYIETSFLCGCGANHLLPSTMGGTVNVDICKECHPYFTGKKREVDTAGRIDKFRARQAAAQAA